MSSATTRVLTSVSLLLMVVAVPASAEEPRVDGFLRVQWHVT